MFTIFQNEMELVKSGVTDMEEKVNHTLTLAIFFWTHPNQPTTWILPQSLDSKRKHNETARSHTHHTQVQYQSEERIRDIQEQLVTLQTSIQRMEHQQTQHHQLAALEVATKNPPRQTYYNSYFQGFENSNARALVVKGINVLLTLLQVKKTFPARPTLRHKIDLTTFMKITASPSLR